MERLSEHNLERLPNERVGHWAERLLVAVINQTGNAEAERTIKGGGEDNHGVDMWVRIEGFREPVPIDLTLNTDPEIIGEKHRKALETGYVVFEAAYKYGISVHDLESAAHGGGNFQKKILDALDDALNDWAEGLHEEGRSFITRRELADKIAENEARVREAQQRHGPRRPKQGHGFYKRKKRLIAAA